MRDLEEKFILSPKEVFQQEIIDTRIDFLIERLNSLEEKINRISQMLEEISERLGTSKNIFEVTSTKRYGFEPQTKLD